MVDEERYDIEAKCLHNTREVSLQEGRGMASTGWVHGGVMSGVGGAWALTLQLWTRSPSCRVWQVATWETLVPPLQPHRAGDGQREDNHTDEKHKLPPNLPQGLFSLRGAAVFVHPHKQSHAG